MRILLDTNVLITLEDSGSVLERSYAQLFLLATANNHQLIVHPASIDDVHRDKGLGRRASTLGRLPAEYIYRHLGHTVDTAAFSVEDPLNPLIWAKNISDALERISKADGWESIVAAKGHWPRKDADSIRTASDIIASDRRFWSEEAKRAALQSRFSRTETQLKQAFEGRFKSVLAELVPSTKSAFSCPTSENLDADQIAHLRTSVQDLALTSEEARTLRHLLIRRLNSLKSKYQWKLGRKLHSLYRIDPTPARIVPSCVESSAWVDDARECITAGWAGRLRSDKSSSNDPDIDWLARGSALLIFDAGLVIPERWRQTINNLDNAVPHPAGVQAALVPITTYVGPAKFLNSQSGLLSQSDPAAGFTLTGPSALFALRARTLLERRPELKTGLCDAISGRLAVLLGGLTGSADDALGPVFEVSRLAIRLRRSGVLCAYYDASLPGSDLPPGEFVRLMQRAVSRSTPELVGQTRKQPQVSAHAERTAVRDEAETFRKELKRLFIASRESSDRQRARLALIDGLKNLSINHEPGSWIGVSIAWLMRHIERNLETEVVYNYATYVIYPLARLVVSRSAFDSSAEYLHDARAAILNGLSGDHLLRVRRLAQELFELGVSHNWEEPDFDDDAFGARSYTTKPYLLADYEFSATRRVVDQWTTDSSTAADRGTWHRCGAMLDLQHLHGFRTSEFCGALAKDVQTAGSTTFLYVRPNRRRRLKTTASTRVVRIDAGLSKIAAACALTSGSMEIIERSRRKASHPTSPLFPVDPKSGEPQILTASVLANALSQLSPTAPRRLYSGRHTTGCAQVLFALSSKSNVLCSPIFELRDAPTDWAHAPSSIQLLWASRSLGHARRSTTLTHYFHFFGEVAISETGDLESEAMDIAVVSLASRLSPMSLRNRLSTAKMKSADAFACVWMSRKSELTPDGSTVPISTSLNMRRPAIAPEARHPISRTTAELMTFLSQGPSALLDDLEGDRDLATLWLSRLTTLAAAPNSLVNLGDLAEASDWISGSSMKAAGPATSMTRGPQQVEAMRFAEGLDVLLHRDPSGFDQLLSLLERAVHLGSDRIPCNSATETALCKRHLPVIVPEGYSIGWSEFGPKISQGARGRSALWFATSAAIIGRGIKRFE